MKNQVIRRNKKVMAILGACLIAAAIVIALFVIFLQGNDRIIAALVFGIIWALLFIAYIYYLTWKISFNDEELCIRYFFITIKYKRDDVVVKNEKRMVRTRGFSTNEVEFQVIRRISDNKLISTIRYHDDNALAYDILKTIPKDRKFLMSTKRDRTTAKDFGLVEKDGRYFNEKDGSEWVPHPMYDYGSGPENGFYKLPLGSFIELITYMEEKQEDWDQSLPAAVMILEKYPQELKKYLMKKIKDGSNYGYRSQLLLTILHITRFYSNPSYGWCLYRLIRLHRCLWLKDDSKSRSRQQQKLICCLCYLNRWCRRLRYEVCFTKQCWRNYINRGCLCVNTWYNCECDCWCWQTC